MTVNATEPEGLNIQDLAAQMLGNNPTLEDVNLDPVSDDTDTNIHPAWNEVLSQIPSELHSKVIPTLQKWDQGVSRQFQKIHDQYRPLAKYEEIDPDILEDAIKVYDALTSDPASTWEAIGRAYGLSPTAKTNPVTEEDEANNFNLDDLPPAVKARLNKVDMHDQVLEEVAQDLLARREAEQAAQEEAELEQYLTELHDTYGDFDEDYVIGLLAAGIDGEAAVGKYQQLAFIQPSQQNSRAVTPQVLSSSGGIPSVQSVDVGSLSRSQTESLIAEILRASK